MTSRRVFLIFAGIAVAFVLVEAGLQIAALVVKAACRKTETRQAAGPDAVRLMFLGDSWTYGAEARPGHGFVDVAGKLLSERFPAVQFEIFNLGVPGSNSAECLNRFLDNYGRKRPHILIVLAGINNGWNTNGVDLAKARLFLLSGPKDLRGKASGSGFAYFLDLKIVKLFKIMRYNYLVRHQHADTRSALFAGKDAYVNKMHTLIGQEGQAAARDYVVSNRDKAKDYDQFFRCVVYTCGYDLDKARDFLKQEKLYKPELLKFDYDREFKNQKVYTALGSEILAEHLLALKRVCDQEGIELVLQTYPFLRPHDFFNQTTRRISREHAILCVDQDAIFDARFSEDECGPMFSRTHPYDAGHAAMAENLVNFVIENRCIEKQLQKRKPDSHEPR